jgi:hypothetical protein
MQYYTYYLKKRNFKEIGTETKTEVKVKVKFKVETEVEIETEIEIKDEIEIPRRLGMTAHSITTHC